MNDVTRPLGALAQEALDVQDACNLSGVALGFGRAMVELRHHVGGGDPLRTHPITVLWMDKLADMTGRGQAEYGAAYDACTALTVAPAVAVAS